MGSAHELQSFWTSLITENGISPHVESLMKINDTEERSLALMSRVFFLWCMGIKYQREDLENTFTLIKSILSKSSGTKGTCSKCSEIKLLLEKTDFFISPKSFDDQTKISSKRRSLSNTPPQLLKKLCRRDKENIDSSPEESLSVEIWAPETEPFLQMNERVNNEFIIPETVPAEEGFYGNTDFFNTLQDLKEKSPVSKKCNTSPILGKFYKPGNSPVTVRGKTPSKFGDLTNPILDITSVSSCVRRTSPDKVKRKSPDKTITSPDSVSNSPSLLGCNIINQIPLLSCSTSSVKEKKNVQHPLMRNIDSKEERSLTPSKSKFTIDIDSDVAKTSFQMNRTLRSSSSRNSFLKCKSEMGGVLSNRGRLSRLKSLTAVKDQNPKLKDFVSPKETKKTYKQTKITKDSFLKRTNDIKLIGGKCDVVNVNDDDDEEKALRQAIEASLHSKEIEDVLRKKHEKIESPKIKKMVNKSPLEKSTRKNPLESSIRKSPRTKCQKSLKFTSPSKDSKNKVSEEEVLTVLDNDQTIKDEKEDGVQTMKNNEEDDLAKVRKIKKKVFQDSFDVLPTKNDEPKYAYKGNVVRKNSEKQRLNGWNCHECRDYYESKDLTEEQRKVLQNKCSRHRSKYRPLTNTPEGFWNVGWSDDEET